MSDTIGHGNGFFTQAPGAPDGFEGRIPTTHAQIEAQRERIRRALQLDRLREQMGQR